MKNIQKIFITLIVLVIVGGVIDLYIAHRSSQGTPSEHESISPENKLTNLEPEATSKATGPSKNMKIESPVFLNNQLIPSQYTCDGENINPPLQINDIPAGTKSLSLIVDDPDAPAGTWVHWVVWNISPNSQEIEKNSVPEGAVQGMTSFGKSGYGGPCPPSGTHRYFFKLFALDTTLSLDSQAKANDLEKAMEGHILAQAQLVGLYQRQ